MVVRSEDVGFVPEVNDLCKSAGKKRSLKPKGDFQWSPHLKLVRRSLIAHGKANHDNDAIRTRDFTLVEQLENRERGTGDRAMLERLIANSTDELAALSKGDI